MGVRKGVLLNERSILFSSCCFCIRNIDHNIPAAVDHVYVIIYCLQSCISMHAVPIATYLCIYSVCAPNNREGFLCEERVPGYGPTAYSPNMPISSVFSPTEDMGSVCKLLRL